MRYLFAFLLFILPSILWAQDSTKTNQDAIYSRPFMGLGKTNTAVGGYIEGNTNYFSTDGVSDGYSAELRRFNIFLFSTISPRIKFLSELEFEHGVEEISLETALIDFEVNPILNLRAGIILIPIGAFNQNHDSPKWEFINRPLVSTQLIPSTLSEVGFGVHGKIYKNQWILAYETYLTNGLGDGIINNNVGRTSLQAGKSKEMFAEDNNGTPMWSAKLGIKNRIYGELGVSYYGGVYNTFKRDGVQIAPKRSLAIWALDFNTQIRKLKINAEAAYIHLDVPNTLGPAYGSQQWGMYLEGIYPVWKHRIAGYNNTIVNLCLRLEQVDYNLGHYSETQQPIYDDVRVIVPGISLRPSANTVLRFNYRYHLERDQVGNPASQVAGFQVGVASYF